MTIISKLLTRNLQAVGIGLAILAALSLPHSAIAQSQDEGSRQIVLDEFTRARPAKASATPSSPANQTTRRRPPPPVKRIAQRPTYHRAGTTLIVSGSVKQPATTEELGVTLWRLRQSKPNDSGARLLVRVDPQSTQSAHWTPERIEADTPLNIGERVRLSVESPRAGYLYVVDREQYADGSLGDAYLIFPTRNTRGGDNRVMPGRLIDIPAQEDDPNFFTLVPSPSRSDQVAEVLSFIVTPQPLEGLPISDKPLKVSKSDIAKWEKTWSSEVERFEMNGGAGRTWTTEEQAASASSSSRLLTQEEPAPQTVYRISSKSKTAILVTVPLRYGK
jgi:hypothetical protein